MPGLLQKPASQIPAFHVSPLTEALRRGDFAVIFHWFFRWFVGAAIIGFIGLVLYAGLPTGAAAPVRVVTTFVFFASACTVCGWLLGLLFGIPRTLARPQPAPLAEKAGGTDGSGKENAAPAQTGAAPAATSRVNTNLEDISDWLTKTLVGVGLTQLYFVPHYVWQSAAKISTAAGLGDSTGGQTLFLSLFLFFAPAGFWLGYVGTRTILTKFFDDVERPSASAIAASLSPDALRLDPDGNVEKATDSKVQAADAELLKYPVTALNTSRELAAWGLANARANNLDNALVALQEASRADPADRSLEQALATVYTAQGKKGAARQILKDDKESDTALFNALYEPPPEGFQKAIEIGKTLSQRADAANNLSLHIWLAAAYGQQHAYAKQTENADLAAEARLKVIEEARAALKIAPDDARRLLWKMWRPETGALDNDLASIPDNDPELGALLSQPS